MLGKMFLVGETVRDGQKTMLHTFKISQFWVGETVRDGQKTMLNTFKNS